MILHQLSVVLLLFVRVYRSGALKCYTCASNDESVLPPDLRGLFNYPQVVLGCDSDPLPSGLAESQPCDTACITYRGTGGNAANETAFIIRGCADKIIKDKPIYNADKYVRWGANVNHACFFNILNPNADRFQTRNGLNACFCKVDGCNTKMPAAVYAGDKRKCRSCPSVETPTNAATCLVSKTRCTGAYCVATKTTDTLADYPKKFFCMDATGLSDCVETGNQMTRYCTQSALTCFLQIDWKRHC